MSNPYVHRDRSKRLLVSLSFLFAAIGLGVLAVLTAQSDSFLSGTVWDKAGLSLCSISLLVAAFQAYRCRRSGLFVALGGTLFAAIFLIRSELSFYPWVNSWTVLNLPGQMYRWFGGLVGLGEIRIATAALVVVAFVLSVCQLLPSDWNVRRKPISERTWPSFVISFVVLAIWFVHSVSPYRVAGIVDRDVSPDLVILHIEKHGLKFRETAADLLLRQGDFFMRTNERQLFQYAFTSRKALGARAIPNALSSAAVSSLQFATGNNYDWSCASAIHTWNEDAWYVLTTKGLWCFKRSQHSDPPAAITELLHQLSIQPLRTPESDEIRDVCLGFCYDPIAGLGSLFASQRCRVYPNGNAVCR